jgi:hypothetical protein
VNQVRADRGFEAFDRKGRLLGYVESAPHLPISLVADAQRTGRRALLHARSDVHRQAADRALAVHAAAQQDRAGVDSDPDIETIEAMIAPHVLGDDPPIREEGQAAAHSALRIAFVRLECAESGQQAVTRILQSLPSMRLDDSGPASECSIHDGMDVFRLQVPAQLCRTDHIDEQNRDLLELLCGRLGG